MKIQYTVCAVAAAVVLLAGQAYAKVGQGEADALGKTLTPVGAERAGNKEGTIPEWTPEPQRGPPSGDFPANPKIDGDKPLFTISKANMAQYGAKLTEGHKKLLSTYDSYKMNVYPSHRLVDWPSQIKEATVKNASSCEMQGSDLLNNCTLGFPFPIPKTGPEPIWNHKLKWRGEAVTRYNNQLIVQASGDYQLTKIIEDVTFPYASIKSPQPLGGGPGQYLTYLSRVVAPTRLAGTFVLVYDKTGSGTEGRVAYLGTPGLRLRRAPTVCCDNPYEGSDGHQFYDQVDMYNGVLERYDWKLVGKKEIYIPYNSNLIAGRQTKYKDFARPKHLNQDLPRYELHRVWVVEANLKPGTSHRFKTRRFYVDEDSWTIAAVDNYDVRDQLYQFQEGHIISAPNIHSATTVPEVIYHFDSGRYFVTAAWNEDKPIDATVTFRPDYFTPASVQKMKPK